MQSYTATLGSIIAKAQITNGGPVILFQMENEYNAAVDPYPFPDYDYWKYVDNQFRSHGVVVPYVNNEAWQLGAITALTPAKVDIYGHDGYPLGFDCWNPTVWPENGLPTDWLTTNNAIAPTTPYTIVEVCDIKSTLPKLVGNLTVISSKAVASSHGEVLDSSTAQPFSTMNLSVFCTRTTMPLE